MNKNKFFFTVGFISLILLACSEQNNTQTPPQEDVPVDDSVVQFDIPKVLTTTENAESIEIGVKLKQAPKTDIIFEISSSNEQEGKVSPNIILFSIDNWNVEQKLTITGVDDQEQDGNQSYKVTIKSRESSDTRFNHIVKTIDMINIDNEGNEEDNEGNEEEQTPSTPNTDLVIITKGDKTWTTEKGDTASFKIHLASTPSADVRIQFSSNNEHEAIVETKELIFTSENYNIPQEVIIKGVDDDIKDGNQPFEISLNISSDDKVFHGYKVNPIRMSNRGDEEPAEAFVTVLSEDHGLITDENLTTDFFYADLSRPPAYPVHVYFKTDSPSEVDIHPRVVTFYPNTSVIAEISVIGIDDNEIDGDRRYYIDVDKIESEDPMFHYLDNIEYTKDGDTNLIGFNYDNDGANDVQPGLIIEPVTDDSEDLTRDRNDFGKTSETGDYLLYTIKMRSAPLKGHSVVVTSVISDPSEAKVEPRDFYFDSKNWNDRQTFKIIGVDDNVLDGHVSYGVRFISSSSDVKNDALTSEYIVATNLDDECRTTDCSEINDIKPELLLEGLGEDDKIYVNKAGVSHSIFFSVTHQPEGNIEIYVETEDGNIATSTAYWYPVVITPYNWTEKHEVRITGKNDYKNTDTEFNIDIKINSDDDRYPSSQRTIKGINKYVVSEYSDPFNPDNFSQNDDPFEYDTPNHNDDPYQYVNQEQNNHVTDIQPNTTSNYLANFIHNTDNGDGTATQRLRITAANISSGGNQQYEEYGVRILQALNADIMLLQEFRSSASYVTDILKQTFKEDTYYVYTGEGRIGNGIVSKFPFIKTGYYEGLMPDRFMDYAIIDIPGEKDLLVFTLHLSTKLHAEEAPILAEAINELNPNHQYYTVIGGDFNTTTASKTEGMFYRDHCNNCLKSTIPDDPTSYQRLCSYCEDLKNINFDIKNLKYKSPMDREGNIVTNATQYLSRQHDYILVDADFNKFQSTMTVCGQDYPYGYILRTSTEPNVSCIYPVQSGDTEVTGMQHMAVTKDFVYTYKK